MGQAAAFTAQSNVRQTLDSLVQLYATLLDVSEAIASHQDLEALMHDLPVGFMDWLSLTDWR